MKVLCALSGIEFNCDHFPSYLCSREVSHPIFSLPQKKLISYLGKWAGGSLTSTDSYLLFLATLNSTDLVEFRVPASRNHLTDSIISQNMEQLAKTVIKLNLVTHPAAVFPRYAIGPETKFLTNVSHWIENWESAWQEFQDGYSRELDTRKLVTRESALERLIKNPHLPISSYASKIADWAAIAGNFPTYLTTSPHTQLPIGLDTYWKHIIQKCARDESMFSVPQADIVELLEHCEENIPIGSIFSNALFKILRHTLERQKNFLGLGDMDLYSGKARYEILSSSDTIESANIKAMIASAPEHEPKELSYPNKISYLKAKLRWQMARKYAADTPTLPTPGETE